MRKKHRDRRHVPHKDEGPGAVCLTWRLSRRHPALTAAERDTALDVILRTPAEWCTLGAVVVMDDHIHVLVRSTGSRSAAQLAQAWKSISSREIVRRGHKTAPIWQAEYFDRWMASDRHTNVCIRYIKENPGRRWPSVVEYRWLVVLPLPPQAPRFF
jgi:REP element-mobilizing transposase RayT